MDELETIKEWYRYNSLVRKGYLRTLLALPPSELTRDRGASFPPLVDILVHTLDAYRGWFLGGYLGRSAELKDLAADGPLTIDQALEAEAVVDREVRGIVDELKPAELDRVVTVPGEEQRPGGGRITERDLLWHMVEEELQHRGELNALLWQIDVTPPVLGWDDHRIPFYRDRALGILPAEAPNG